MDELRRCPRAGITTVIDPGATFNAYPDLHCSIKKRIVQGNTVIDEEYVTATGIKPIEGTVVY